MSVVAVKIYKDRIGIAADSFVGHGDIGQTKMRDAKICKIKDGYIFGSAGYLNEVAFFRQFCKTHTPKSMDEGDLMDFMSDFGDFARKKTGDVNFKSENETILIFNKRVVSINCGSFSRHVKKWFALGAGSYHASTALFLGHTEIEAVNAACELTAYCEKPIQSFSVKL